MIRVFHIFKKHTRFPKSNYTTQVRKSFAEWEERIFSQSGYIQNGRLLLPKDREPEINAGRAGAIVMQDVVVSPPEGENEGIGNPGSPSVISSELWGFNRENRAWSFEIFSMEEVNPEQVDLHLKYEANKFYMGAPRRDDHKLCALKRGKPVKISINGKTDFSFSGRRERTYSEYIYILEYLGDVQSVEFVPFNRQGHERQLPGKFEKEIDLRKLLY